MVHIVDHNSDHVFMCDCCNMHFRDQKDAEACERYCSLNDACSDEISAKSIERQEHTKPTSA